MSSRLRQKLLKIQEESSDRKDEESEESESEEDSSDSSESESDIEPLPIHQEQEIVWGKVRGHAWWPAKIGKICDSTNTNHQGGKPTHDVRYLLLFIGDHSRCQLNQKQTRKFEETFFELAFNSKAKKSLAVSIKKACFLYEMVKPGLK